MPGNNENSEESLIEKIEELTQENEELTQKVRRLRLLRGELKRYGLVDLINEAIGDLQNGPDVKFKAYQEYVAELRVCIQRGQFIAPDQTHQVTVYGQQDTRGGNYGREWAEYERREGVELDTEEKANWVRSFREWYETKRKRRNDLSNRVNGMMTGFSEEKLELAKREAEEAEAEADRVERDESDVDWIRLEKKKKERKVKAYKEIKDKGEDISRYQQEMDVLSGQIGSGKK